MPAEPMTNHMLLTGNPGTGKTIISRKIGELMFELGLTNSPQVVYMGRKDLVGKYANTASQTTYDLITKNRGKTIFVDEAYTLYQGPQDHEGRQALDELMRLAEEYRGDTSIILAGYEGEMADMFRVNPGLKSRFPNHVDLPDYTPEEKSQILHYTVETNNRTYADRATKKLAGQYAGMFPSTGELGNARAIRKFYDAMRDAHARRVAADPAGADATVLATFTRDDVKVAAANMGLPPVVKVRAPKKGAATKRQAYQTRRSNGPVVARTRLAGVSGPNTGPGTGTTNPQRRRLNSVPVGA
jgi:Cdc6-like AAA superfamily ATPase